MKGFQGIAVAAVLGLLGAGLNWVYLSQKTKAVDSLGFVGVAPGRQIATGQPLGQADLAEVRIPRLHARNLENYVYLWQDVETVVGIKATRAYQGGDLVLISDYRTPPPQLELAENERLIIISVDSRSFVPALVDPGDYVTFLLPKTHAAVDSAVPGGAIESIGPFKVGSLGNRLGSRDVMQANRLSPVQERQVGIVVRVDAGSGSGKLERSALTLLERLRQTGHRNVGVLLHPKP